jgi:hypothetical protein
MSLSLSLAKAAMAVRIVLVLAISCPRRLGKHSKDRFPPESQIIRFEAGVLGDAGQYPRANHLARMECKDIDRIICMFKCLAGTCMILNSLSNRLECI